MDKSAPDGPPGAWLIEECANRVAEVMEAMTGTRPGITTSSGAADDDATAFWWRQSFSIAPDHALYIGCLGPAWHEIGNRVLIAAGVDGSSEDDIRGTYLEILSQSFAGVAQTLSRRLRKEVNAPGGKEEAPQPAAALKFTLKVSFGQTEVALAIAFAESLLAALTPVTASTEPAQSDSAAQAPSPKTGTPKGSAPKEDPRSLELLFDVELPVSVSFGRAQLALKDVIKLTTGSIVELNRTVNEPVEVIVNNCVIARGEVVVVEGNFGIRIQQVVSRQDRLRTLT